MTDYPITAHPHGLLTPRRRAILRAIADHSAAKGAPPSMREIGLEVGMREASVHYHLARLIDGGLVTKEPYISRASMVTDAGRAALEGAAQ